MTASYKGYMIFYKEEGGKIVVTSIIFGGNFQCMYGTRIYDSLSDVKADIDAGKYGGRHN